MEKIDILKQLFDEKIVSITHVFLEEQNNTFSLSQISSMSKVNIATTLRILDKLIKQGFIDLVIVGKSKFYKLKKNEKTLLLSKFLKTGEEPILEFLQNVKSISRIKKVILEDKTNKNAKLIIIGDLIPTEKIDLFVEQIKKQHNFKINYIAFTEKQFVEMSSLGFYDLEKKIIWQEEQSTLKVS